MKKDYYEILGVDKNASQDEIKKTFRKKAMEHHPDKNNGDDTKFKEINEAYSVLSDEKKRANYDNFGSADMGGFGAGGQGFGGFDFSQAQGFGGQGFDFDLGDIFGDFFGGGQRTSQRRKRGADIEIALNISFKESILGTEKTIKLKRDIKCDSCHGSGAEGGKTKKCQTCGGSGTTYTVQNTPFGQIQRQAVCQECGGLGEIPEKKCSVCGGAGVQKKDDEIKIHIPAGVENGQQLRVAGKGNEIKNGESGDLYIYLEVEENKNFERFGNDLYTVLEIDYPTAVLGGVEKVQGVEGEIKIKIPAGTQSGEKFKIKKEGVRSKFGAGDLYAKIKIKVPEKPSKKYKKLVEELRELGE